MADGTHIEWTDATANAVNGCSLASPGCTNCYAMRLAGTRLRHHPSRAGLTIPTKAGPVWTGEVRLNEAALLQPLRWRRPRRIFWNAHGDLFHPNVPDEWIDRVFAICALTPQHQHQILTKRADRMRAYFLGGAWDRIPFAAVDMKPAEKTARASYVELVLGAGCGLQMKEWPLPNVWLGVSVEDQARADERIPDLLATTAAVRFLSCEPLLGPVDLERWLDPTKIVCRDVCSDARYVIESEISYVSHNGEAIALCPSCGLTAMAGTEDGVDWVICGGESGKGARLMDEAWAESLRDQCRAAGVAFFMKQMAKKAPIPERLFVREMPA